MRHSIEEKVQKLVHTQSFKKLQQLTAQRNGQNHVQFSWPLRSVPAYDHIPFNYTIPFFVDHDPTSGLLDYECNERTYDGHYGTDINIWPFFWHMMEEEYVEIIAAAPGIVVEADDDNNNDMNCSCPAGASNNCVAVLHADTSISFYMHVKDNSIVVVDSQVVAQGQKLALVGSSGCSYNPHLHFEVHAPDGLIDPFAGSCNSLNGNDSWWQDQPPYWEPRINRLMTHSANPSLHGYNGNNGWCAAAENILAKNQFNPGDIVWFGCALYSPQPSDEVDFQIYAPNGTLLWTNTYTHAGSAAVSVYHTFSYGLLPNASSGTYRFRAAYNGRVYNHWFTVGCTSAYTLSGSLAFHHGYIASGTITNSGQTSGTAGNTAYYQAGDYIRFLPGFDASPGTSLKARIRSCSATE